MLIRGFRLANWCSTLLFGSCLLTSCTHSKEKIIATYDNGRAQVVYVFPDASDTLTYTLKILGPSGNIKQLAFVAHGLFVNKAITYTEDGKVQRVDSLLSPCNGLRTCDKIEFFYNDNGTLSQMYTVRNGIKDGITKQYDSKGNLIKSYSLIYDSIKDGEYLEYFDNGEISFKAQYKNDTLVGIGYIFKENGDSSRWFTFYKGQNNLPTKIWLDNGDTQTGDYLGNGRDVVIWKWYDNEGHEIRRVVEHAKNGRVVRPN